MSKIKKFFSRKKEEAKFKLNLGGGAGMGKGRALNAEAPTPSTSKKHKDAYIPPQRSELSDEAKTAAAAALARIEKKTSKDFNTSLSAIRAQAKKELEAEQKLKEEFEKTKIADESGSATSEITNKNYVCDGVFFRCPLVSDEVLPRKDWKVKIKDFLYQQLEHDRGLTSCLIIHNCNTKEKVESCVDTLRKYLENIIAHPEEEKFLKIRMSNRIFCEKVRYVEGALEFLKSAGFVEQEIDGELFLLWGLDNMEEGIDLPALLDGLQNAEPLHLELDRNLQVLLPSQARRIELPPDFFRLTPEEIKREQKLKSEALESAQVLKTKAMREREEIRILNTYKYALIRIKFPDGICLQGTFNVYEKLNDVYEFVQSCLQHEAGEFCLVPVGSSKFGDEDLEKSLYDLRLIPTLVLMFHKNNELQAEAHFIKEELLMLIRSM